LYHSKYELRYIRAKRNRFHHSCCIGKILANLKNHLRIWKKSAGRRKTVPYPLNQSAHRSSKPSLPQFDSASRHIFLNDQQGLHSILDPHGMDHTIPYPWAVEKPRLDLDGQFHADHDVSYIIAGIGQSIARKHGFDYDLGRSRPLTNSKHQIKAAVNSYTADFSSLWSKENHANFRRSAIVLRGCGDHPKFKTHFGLRRIDPEIDKNRCLRICDQLADLLAYCEKCDSCPALFVLVDDASSTDTHVCEHEGLRRGEAKQLRNILREKIFAPGEAFEWALQHQAPVGLRLIREWRWNKGAQEEHREMRLGWLEPGFRNWFSICWLPPAVLVPPVLTTLYWMNYVFHEMCFWRVPCLHIWCRFDRTGLVVNSWKSVLLRLCMDTGTKSE